MRDGGIVRGRGGDGLVCCLHGTGQEMAVGIKEARGQFSFVIRVRRGGPFKLFLSTSRQSEENYTKKLLYGAPPTAEYYYCVQCMP